MQCVLQSGSQVRRGKTFENYDLFLTVVRPDSGVVTQAYFR